MSTYSPSLRIELINTGDQAGTWGVTTNSNLGTLIESAIAGYTSVSITSANQALTALNGVADESRNQTIALTTTTTANFNVYAPPAEKTYIIYNASLYTATIYNSTVLGNTTAAGTGVAVPAGKTMTIWSDGTNFKVQNDHLTSVTLGTDLAIADGGTGASTAADARTNLGVTATGQDTTYAYRANNLSDLASASSARTNLGLGTMATQSASAVSITGGSITGITDLAVADGGTGASSFTNGGLLRGNGTGALSVASAADIVAAIGTTAVTNATNATNATTATSATTATTATSATTATNIAGGAANRIAYNTGSGTTAFITAPTVTSTFLQWNGSAFTWAAAASSSVAGSNTQIQFNNAGAFGASSNLTFANDTLSVNGVSVGRGGGGSLSNTAIGNTAFGVNTSGASNVAVGYAALFSNDVGSINAAVGYGALYSNTSGSSNTAVGFNSLTANTTGSSNTAVGRGAFDSNTSGSYNVAVGELAGGASSNSYCTYIGANAGLYRTADSNTAVGASAMEGTFLGSNSGANNAAFGTYALRALTTGNYNTGIGDNVATLLTTGSSNVFVGYTSGSAMTTGSNNIIVGSYSGNSGGLDISASSNNIVLSDGAGNPRWYTDSTGATGYSISNGGTVTQITSRTTGVTLNKPTGSITLVSAAGTTTWNSFTVTNNTVRVTDTIIVNQRSGTDLYEIHVTAVTTGTFRLSFRTTGGTTTEQPVFNFAVIKGQIS